MTTRIDARTTPRVPAQRRRPDVRAADVTGTIRLDQRGARLLARLHPGDVAVLDQMDIDLETAIALVARRPAAIVNAAVSATGRSPGLGAAILVAAGVLVVDEVGPQLLAAVDDGDPVTVTTAGEVVRDGAVLAVGRPLDRLQVTRPSAGEPAAGLRSAFAGCGAALPGVLASEGPVLVPALRSPASTRRRHVTAEREDVVPDLAALLRARGRRGRGRARRVVAAPVLVVSGGAAVAVDLGAVRRSLAGAVTVATVTGSEVLADRRRTADVVVGDARTLTDRVLAVKPFVVHLVPPTSDPTEVDEARERLARAAVPVRVWPTALAAPEAAVLLSATSGTPLTVTAGYPRGMLEFCDRSPLAMAGAALTSAAVGHAVVAAPVVPLLGAPRVSWGSAALPTGAGVLALAIALAVLAGWEPGADDGPGLLAALESVVRGISGAVGR